MSRKRSTALAPTIDYDRLAASVIKGMTGIPGLPVSPNYSAYGGTGVAIPLAPGGWVDPMVAFGPGRPIPPAPIDPLGLGGRPEPRRWDYPTSFNLPGVGSDKHQSWTVLRRLGDTSIIRRCIEIRKAEMASMEWDVVISKKALMSAVLEGATPRDKPTVKRAMAGDPDAMAQVNRKMRVTKQGADTALRHKYADLITTIREWWDKPDRINDLGFRDWMGQALEEHFVLDALAIYPHLDYAGRLHSLRIIAGDTIKPLLDHLGNVPQQPDPAYQQILHGFPRGEYVTSTDDSQSFPRDTLYYRPRVRRASSPYGFSNTEQAIADADLYLKRQAWMMAEYTAGVVPEMFVTVDTPLTPDQLLAYERIFNDTLSGQTAERHRAKMLPAGFTPVQLTSFEERYRPDLDEHLIRLIGMDFDVRPTELGFPPKQGLGGKGISDSEEDSANRVGNRPLGMWFVDAVLNDISIKYLGMTKDLTFDFLGKESEDEAAAMATLEAKLKYGGLTVNEMRDEIGMPRYSIKDADSPMFITTREVIPLDGITSRAALEVMPPAAPGGAAPPKPRLPHSAPGRNPPKMAELDAFRTRVRNQRKKGVAYWRPFEFHEDQDAGLPEILNKLAASGQYDAIDTLLDTWE